MLKVLDVFTNKTGRFGNPVGIIEDFTKEFNNKDRQRNAISIGYSEIVFINDVETRDISIFSPTGQIPFAGHALVGTSYYFNNILKIPTTEIISINNKIKTYQQNNLTFVDSDISILPNWNFKELETPEEVEQITFEESKLFNHTFVWSFVNKEKGLIRARTFASDWKIPEDEANGSGSMLLAHILNKKLEIHHGMGSIIYTTPHSVGGMVKYSEDTKNINLI